jgi:hypothetical protein
MSFIICRPALHKEKEMGGACSRLEGTGNPYECGVMVIVLAIGHKVRRFKPGPEQWIYKDDNNPYNFFFRKGK